MTLLAHVTLATGHRRMVRRRDIDDAEVSAARDVIDAALATNAAELPQLPGYGLAVEPFGAAARFVVVAPPRDRPMPLVVFGVSPRPRSGKRLWQLLVLQANDVLPGRPSPTEPRAPWCGAVPMPGLLFIDDAEHVAEEIGRLEAAFAWAWLERGDAG